MKAAFVIDACAVTVAAIRSRLPDGTASSTVWGVVRPQVEPHHEQFHCVRFEIDRDGDAEISIAPESHNLGGVMGAKMEQATAIAEQQIAHFKAMKQTMQGMAGNPEPILDAMRKGDFSNAGFMLIMCPTPESKQLTPEAKQALPCGSKADSVITAVVLEPSFKDALAMLAFDERAVRDQDLGAYKFAMDARNQFNKPYRGALKEEMLAAPEEERSLASLEHQKLIEYIG
ncbi:hypothetical protein ACTG16_23560 [Aeromonas sp. 23P]|uniref:hypothetical protein n=1 Tax=Aeromonas sp. 23P TaxID=3452716 RepID=UPI003F7A9228